MGASELVMRAAELSADGDLEAALRALRRERTFDLQAAYATAIRQHNEPGHADAAALLEAALVARRRDVVGGARWYHHPERLVAIWLAVEVLRWTVYAGRWGWTSAVVALAVAALVYGGALLLLRRLYARAADTAHGSAAAHGRTDLAIVSDVTRAVVDRAEQADDPAPDDLVEEAVGAARGIATPLLAAAGLSRAERLLASMPRPSDRRRARAVGEARQQLLARERRQGRALPELLLRRA